MNHDVRWSVSPYEDKPGGAHISIDVWLDCGCEIRDLESFASQMREQEVVPLVVELRDGGPGVMVTR
jgi:hypothetical protein